MLHYGARENILMHKLCLRTILSHHILALSTDDTESYCSSTTANIAELDNFTDRISLAAESVTPVDHADDRHTFVDGNIIGKLSLLKKQKMFRNFRQLSKQSHAV